MDENEMRKEIDAMSLLLTQTLSSMTGPLSDMIRATTNATVDALMAGWSMDLADAAVLTIINRNAAVAEKLAESIRKANKVESGS
jgi:ACT domain-containing protein